MVSVECVGMICSTQNGKRGQRSRLRSVKPGLQTPLPTLQGSWYVAAPKPEVRASDYCPTFDRASLGLLHNLPLKDHR